MMFAVKDMLARLIGVIQPHVAGFVAQSQPLTVGAVAQAGNPVRLRTGHDDFFLGVQV